MPDLTLKQISEELKQTHAAFKLKMDKQDAEIAKLGAPSAETKTMLEKIQDDLDASEKKYNDKLESIEAKFNRPHGDGNGKAVSDEHKAAFIEMVRKGDGRMSPEHIKALATDSDTDGGYLVPTTMRQGIIERLVELSPVRQLANVETLSTGDTLEIPKEGSTDFGDGWTSERAAVTETATGTFAMETITAHEQFAEPRVTQKMLDDSSFDVETWVMRKLSERFAVREGTAFINGNGVGKPFGLLDATAGITEVVSGNATLITADGLIDLAFSLPEFYARNAAWLMKRSTVRDIRKLKDTSNQYLWQPGLAGGLPATILNQPYREAIDMPAIAANSNPVLFGDFRAAYTIVDRQQVRLLRDNLTSKPFVKFYTTKRVGGKVVLAEAMRKLKISV